MVMASQDRITSHSRGMRDLLPAHMRGFRRVEDAFRAAAGRWGYEEVRTPTIENYSLFTTAGMLTPQMLSRVYSFLDWDGWSGERVVLRPDSTIPVSRAAEESRMETPARLFYVQNVFRFNDSGDREDWQCGIEYLGAPHTIGDLEVSAVACETLATLGFTPQVRLSHVGVIRGVLDACGIAAEAVPADLADQISKTGLRALREAASTNAQLSAFVEVALQPFAGHSLIANLVALAPASAPSIAASLDELAGVAGALVASGRDVTVDFSLPRNFEYYTGVVFEFFANGIEWGGGGRYTTASGGTACGLALEAARLASLLASATPRRVVVSIVPATKMDFGPALAVAEALHSTGIAAALANDNRSGTIAVRVGGDSLVAMTPDGDRQMTSLDDVVGLLVQYK
ncbi:hypothetical protein AYO38_03365 [bacterium SCGC AG-212-C10]|nr:hypothetical protein AYO38_03365 [bacterium SCGC AG-212-C10]